jgi:hypothetical protein
MTHLLIFPLTLRRHATAPLQHSRAANMRGRPKHDELPVKSRKFRRKSSANSTQPRLGKAQKQHWREAIFPARAAM